MQVLKISHNPSGVSNWRDQGGCQGSWFVHYLLLFGSLEVGRFGGSGLPTQLFAKLGYLAIALSGIAGLSLVNSSSKWETDEASVAGDTFEHRWYAFESEAEPKPLIVADTLIEPRSPPPETEPEQRPIRLAALDPDARSLDHYDQPASKGYILYFNSPTHWTPVPVPDGIGDARAPHNNNIRAEIEQAAMLFNVDIRMMKAFARIESGYNPRATTGKYKCLFQLSNWEFAKYWQGDIYDIRDCSIAAARKLATETAEFEKDVGRSAKAAEIYCIHQQGYQGCAFHHAAPHQLAWKNMYLTNEGQERGKAWSRKAIWGNVPSDLKGQLKGGVETLTSGEFIAIWTERVERFMARRIEPPTHYVERASKAKKPTKVAATGKKKAAAISGNKKKSKTKVARR